MALQQLLMVSRLWRRCRSRLSACWERLVGEHFAYNTDYFFGLDSLSVVAGIRLTTSNETIRRWWNVYRCVPILAMVLLTWKFVNNVLKRKDLAIILNGVQGQACFFTGLCQVIILARNYRALTSVRRYVNERRFGRELNSSFDIRRNSFCRIRGRVIKLVALEVAELLPFLALDLSNHDLASLPFRVSQSWLPQFICQKLYSLTFLSLGAVLVANIMTVYMLLSGLNTELEVIVESFKTVMDRAANRAQSKVASTPGSSDQLQIMIQHYFWKYVDEELAESCNIHLEFLDNLNVVKPLLNGSFLVVHFSSCINMACGAVFLLTSATKTVVFSAQVFYYVALQLFECCIFTNLVTTMTDLNESIGWQLYDQDWPTWMEFDQEHASEYRSMRASMLNVMIFTQQPLRLNCFGFFEFTQERVTELVNMAYSLTTFFKDLV